MILGRDIHMLSCANMFFSAAQARELAQRMGIEVEPVYAPSSTVFIVAPRGAFRDVWMDRRDGFYLMKGRMEHGDSMLHKSNGEVGTVQA